MKIGMEVDVDKCSLTVYVQGALATVNICLQMWRTWYISYLKSTQYLWIFCPWKYILSVDNYGYVTCTIHIFIELMSLHGNTSTITLIALERCLSVEYPLRSITWITPTRTKRVICFTWFIIITKVSLETLVGKDIVACQSGRVSGMESESY